MNILSHTFDEFVAWLNQHHSKGSYHATGVFRQVFSHHNKNFCQAREFFDNPRLAQILSREIQTTTGRVIGHTKEQGVIKFVVRLVDGHTIESVIIPMATHNTLCVSSQVGCRMGCTFCQTGKMGLTRNLTTEEIVSQVYLARSVFHAEIRNVVFMGMGEPLDNFDNVIKAISVMEDLRGINIAKKRITLSTAGLATGLDRLRALKWPSLRVAVSLNSADDTLRSSIMPINKKFPLHSLSKSIQAFGTGKKNIFFIEYVLLKGVNNRMDDARKLADFVSSFPARVNLIPYNTHKNSPYSAPTEAQVLQFRDWLIERRIFVRMRSSRGSNLQAACGQLGKGLTTNTFPDKS